MKELSEETKISIKKGLLGLVPYGGQALMEYFIEHRTRVKQNRINSFIDSFINFLSSHIENEEELNNLDDENFHDIFESILIRISKTNNKAKRDRFNKILLKQVKAKDLKDFNETFLDLIEKLNDSQIVILKEHLFIKENGFGNIKSRYKTSKHEISRLEEELKNQLELGKLGAAHNGPRIEKRLNNERKKLEAQEEELLPLNNRRKHDFYNITKSDYLYYVQDLISKSLLYDSGIGGIGTLPFEILSITDFGERFLEFIKD